MSDEFDFTLVTACEGTIFGGFVRDHVIRHEEYGGIDIWFKDEKSAISYLNKLREAGHKTLAGFTAGGSLKASDHISTFKEVGGLWYPHMPFELLTNSGGRYNIDLVIYPHFR